MCFCVHVNSFLVTSYDHWCLFCRMSPLFLLSVVVMVSTTWAHPHHSLLSSEMVDFINKANTTWTVRPCNQFLWIFPHPRKLLTTCKQWFLCSNFLFICSRPQRISRISMPPMSNSCVAPYWMDPSYQRCKFIRWFGQLVTWDDMWQSAGWANPQWFCFLSCLGFIKLKALNFLTALTHANSGPTVPQSNRSEIKAPVGPVGYDTPRN